MFRVLVVLLFLVAKAHSISVYWHEDSYSAFDVTISGTGLDWKGTLTSPSGLWELYSEQYGGYSENVPGFPEGRIDIGHFGQITFLGEIPTNLPEADSGAILAPWDNVMTTTPYDDFFAPSPSIQDGSAWTHPGFIFASLGWTLSNPLGPTNPFVITSFPDVTDPSTWTWTVEYASSGGSLRNSVPESGGIGCLGFATLLLFAIHRRAVASFAVPSLFS
jgi:hypothetical protein